MTDADRSYRDLRHTAGLTAKSHLRYWKLRGRLWVRNGPRGLDTLLPVYTK